MSTSRNERARNSERWRRFLAEAGDKGYRVTPQQLGRGSGRAWEFAFAR